MNNTLSKEAFEEIVKGFRIVGVSYPPRQTVTEKLIAKACSEYAKQECRKECIAFSDFTTPYYAIMGDKQWQLVEPPFTKYTDDELYDLYILSKQNKEQ